MTRFYLQACVVYVCLSYAMLTSKCQINSDSFTVTDNVKSHRVRINKFTSKKFFNDWLNYFPHRVRNLLIVSHSRVLLNDRMTC